MGPCESAVRLSLPADRAFGVSVIAVDDGVVFCSVSRNSLRGIRHDHLPAHGRHRLTPAGRPGPYERASGLSWDQTAEDLLSELEGDGPLHNLCFVSAGTLSSHS